MMLDGRGMHNHKLCPRSGCAFDHEDGNFASLHKLSMGQVDHARRTVALATFPGSAHVSAWQPAAAEVCRWHAAVLTLPPAATTTSAFSCVPKTFLLRDKRTAQYERLLDLERSLCWHLDVAGVQHQDIRVQMGGRVLHANRRIAPPMVVCQQLMALAIVFLVVG